MFSFEFDNVFVDRSVADTALTRRIQKNVSLSSKTAKWHEIDDYRRFIQDNADNYDFLQGKRNLILYPEKGRFLHACPGSDGVLCCHYHVIDFGMNCPYDCEYCFLQTYLTHPFYTLAANAHELLDVLKQTVRERPDQKWRIGTGEYTDSLAIDHITGLSVDLIKTFSELPNATIELKTKSIHIGNLLTMKPPKGRVVIGWSLNPDSIIRQIEHGCPGLDERLHAAALVSGAGYDLAFHFDPVIYTETWKDDYTYIINKLFKTIDHNAIRWISLGTFRYTQGLKEKLRLRHKDEFITREEMFNSDNKYRYFYPKRIEIYNTLKKIILEQCPQMFVYLCMESKKAWRPVFGFSPQGPLQLDKGFETRRQWIHGL